MIDWEALQHECQYQTSQSGGPGGQHANKVETQVELRFAIPASQVLTPKQQGQVLDHLPHRITKDQVLILRSSESRSQTQNKERVQRRFRQLIQQALTPARRRKPTRPPRRAQEKRLDQKKRRSEKKQGRKPPTF